MTKAGTRKPRRRFGRVGIRRGAGRDVVEEAAPLVEVDDEHRLGPGRAAGDRLVDIGQETLPDPDVAVRMIVAARAGAFVLEAGIDEADGGQLAGLAVQQELRVWAR